MDGDTPLTERMKKWNQSVSAAFHKLDPEDRAAFEAHVKEKNALRESADQSEVLCSRYVPISPSSHMFKQHPGTLSRCRL